ncbi:hypothetical protein AB0N29_19875 [Nocardioides sp. NPDC092400]|uniref:hypothetical protein n=1 Tax=Nocardioides sp. NPDC092400 TaxID=3155196 RepID=UPI003447C10F
MSDTGNDPSAGDHHAIVPGESMSAPGRSNVPGVGPVVESEFASVSVSLDEDGNSVRLRLEDLRTGQVRHLDALELETVIWLDEGHLTTLLDPSADRWRG